MNRFAVTKRNAKEKMHGEETGSRDRNVERKEGDTRNEEQGWDSSRNTKRLAMSKEKAKEKKHG